MITYHQVDCFSQGYGCKGVVKKVNLMKKVKEKVMVKVMEGVM